jgi:Spy/CpxP family protein refolding chaperone
MKIIIAAVAAATALSAIAVAPASAQPYGPPRWHHGHGWHHGYGHPPRRVCYFRYHHRVCRWVR